MLPFPWKFYSVFVQNLSNYKNDSPFQNCINKESFYTSNVCKDGEDVENLQEYEPNVSVSLLKIHPTQILPSTYTQDETEVCQIAHRD